MEGTDADAKKAAGKAMEAAWKEIESTTNELTKKSLGLPPDFDFDAMDDGGDDPPSDTANAARKNFARK